MKEIFDLFLKTLETYENASKWEGSNFEKIKKISNTHVGSVGEDFIEKLCNLKEIKIEFPETDGKRSAQSPWDIKILGVTFELKTATEDTNGGFQFNHIRYHRKYDALLCLGISPNEILFKPYSKAEVTTGKAGNLVSMEKSGNASYKLTKKPKDMYEISLFKEIIEKFIDDYDKK